MDNQLLQRLARQLNLTNFEQENELYILTQDEENSAISHAIESAKKHAAWKLAQFELPEGDILQRLSVIDWNEEINREEILQRANSSKNYDVWQKQQRINEREAEAAKLADLKNRWTANRFYTVMAWASENLFGKKLIVHDDNKGLIKAICFFLSEDPRFETELNFSFKKGLLIRGVSGLGKTHLVRCVEQNELKPISIISLLEITDIIKECGEYNPLIRPNGILYLDDVGTEQPIVNHYGTKITFFKNFIELFYLRQSEYNKLIISTNNSFEEMEDRYGFRVRSRIKDMFNIINVSGKDMRG